MASDDTPDNGIGQALLQLAEQNNQLRQQVGQLYGAVSLQCNQLLQSDANVIAELRKFQTGGPQRAMAGVYTKLFRELTKFMSHLDDLVEGKSSAAVESSDRSWLEAVGVARSRFETILGDWGCVCIPVQVGDSFDPTIHESVLPEPGEMPATPTPNTIVKIRRRGWILQDAILQHPQVVVA